MFIVDYMKHALPESLGPNWTWLQCNAEQSRQWSHKSFQEFGATQKLDMEANTFGAFLPIEV